MKVQKTSKRKIHKKNKFISIFRHQNKNFIESDNPGSTDSEVRKILTLHIPITEYDTLGSESDNEAGSRALNQAKYRPQRGTMSLINFCNFVIDCTHIAPINCTETYPIRSTS